MRLATCLTCSRGALGRHPNGRNEAVGEPKKKGLPEALRNRRIRGRAARRKAVFGYCRRLGERSLARAPGERASGAPCARRNARPADLQSISADGVEPVPLFPFLLLFLARTY